MRTWRKAVYVPQKISTVLHKTYLVCTQWRNYRGNGGGGACPPAEVCTPRYPHSEFWKNRCPFEAAGYNVQVLTCPLEKVVHTIVPSWKLDPSYCVHRISVCVWFRFNETSKCHDFPSMHVWRLVVNWCTKIPRYNEYKVCVHRSKCLSALLVIYS